MEQTSPYGSAKGPKKKVQQGIGSVIIGNDQLWKLVDSTAHLEYRIQNITTKICDMEIHKLVDMTSSYVRINSILKWYRITVHNSSTSGQNIVANYLVVSKTQKKCMTFNDLTFKGREVIKMKPCSPSTSTSTLSLEGTVPFSYIVKSFIACRRAYTGFTTHEKGFSYKNYWKYCLSDFLKLGHLSRALCILLFYQFKMDLL